MSRETVALRLDRLRPTKAAIDATTYVEIPAAQMEWWTRETVNVTCTVVDGSTAVAFGSAAAFKMGIKAGNDLAGDFLGETTTCTSTTAELAAGTVKMTGMSLNTAAAIAACTGDTLAVRCELWELDADDERVALVASFPGTLNKSAMTGLEPLPEDPATAAGIIAEAIDDATALSALAATDDVAIERDAAGTPTLYKVAWSVLSGLIAPKYNRTATTAPTVTDDTDAGYEQGSLWLDTTAKACYLCSDATAGAAVWGLIPTAVTASVIAALIDGAGTIATPAATDQLTAVRDVTGTPTLYNLTWATIAATIAPQYNRTATTAPTVTDDTSEGYEQGSIWLDTTAKKCYLCSDATEDAAVWAQVPTALGAALTALATLTPAADRLPYFTGATTAALATFTAYARSLLAAANAAAARVLLACVGTTHVGEVSITADDPADNVVTIDGTTGQTGYLLRMRDALGTVVAGIYPSGNITGAQIYASTWLQSDRGVIAWVYGAATGTFKIGGRYPATDSEPKNVEIHGRDAKSNAVNYQDGGDVVHYPGNHADGGGKPGEWRIEGKRTSALLLGVEENEGLRLPVLSATPATPASGSVRLYQRTTGHLYLLADDGTESIFYPLGHDVLAGFVDRDDSAMTMGADTATGKLFEIAPTGTDYTIWCCGTKYVIDDTRSVDITADQTITYVWFGTDGVLTSSTTIWDIRDCLALVAIVFRDGTTYRITDERHAHNRNVQFHRWAHLTIGTRWQDGLAGSFDATTLNIGSGTIFDEDLAFSISAQTSAAHIYRNATTGQRIIGTQTTPYMVTGSDLAYDDGSGTLQAVANNRYGNYWVYATGDQTDPIYIVCGQASYNSLARAQDAQQPTINLSTAEWKLLYRVTYRNTATIAFIEAADYRNVQGPALDNIADDHSSLVNRDATDSHPASAISYDPTASGLSSDDVQDAIDELAAASSGSVVAVGSETLASAAASIDLTLSAAASPGDVLLIDAVLELDDANDAPRIFVGDGSLDTTVTNYPGRTMYYNAGSPAATNGDAYLTPTIAQDVRINLNIRIRVLADGAHIRAEVVAADSVLPAETSIDYSGTLTAGIDRVRITCPGGSASFKTGGTMQAWIQRQSE